MINDGFIKRSSPLRKIGNLILPKVSTVTLKLLNPNADALVLGSTTEEGGDIKVYRDASGNLQMSVDADAASNTKALDIYGGVVAQNYLTIGQNTLNLSAELFIAGSLYATDNQNCSGQMKCAGFGHITSNSPSLPININILTPDATDHSINIQIDSSDIIVAQAAGDGSGGIIDKAIGLYGTTPCTQAAAISDPTESTAANNAAIDSILAALRGIGLIATA